MSVISKSERLLNLVSFLLKSRRPVPLSRILTGVAGYRDEGISDASVERRFERDKAALRDLGVPLEYVEQGEKGGPGYVIPRGEYFLPRIELTAEEAALLSAAGRFALEGAAGPVSDTLKSAVRKLRFDSPLSGEVRGTAEENFLFHRTEASGRPSEQTALAALASAVMARRVVQFRYYGIGRDRVMRRTVEPYGVGFAEGHWYVAGFDRARKGVRVFRVDRIRGEARRLHPDATRPEYDVPEDFRIRDHVGVPPWMFGKAPRVKVRLRFDADVAFMVRMRPSPGDAWQEHEDGSATVTRTVSNPDSLLHWVLGFGRHAEALEPPEFRERVAALLRAVAARHAGRPGKEVPRA